MSYDAESVRGLTARFLALANSLVPKCILLSRPYPFEM